MEKQGQEQIKTYRGSEMRNEVFSILPLTIKKKWFDMILSGEKKKNTENLSHSMIADFLICWDILRK